MELPTSKRAMRQLSVQEKISAVQRVHDGESKASVARLIGVPESTLRGWCKNEMKLRTMTACGSHSQSPSPSPPPPEKRPRLEPLDTEVDDRDALWFWLRNQQQHNDPAATTAVNHNNNHHQSSWFWKWYKEFGVPEPPPAPIPEEPLPLVVRRNKVSYNDT